MEKIKQFLQSEKGKDILTVLIVILVGLGSFELGRLSKENDSQAIKTQDSSPNSINVPDVSISNPDVGIQQGGSPTPGANSNQPFFASSKGKKYYTANCSAGKNIKSANLIYFATELDAQKAGYTLSSSC